MGYAEDVENINKDINIYEFINPISVILHLSIL